MRLGAGGKKEGSGVNAEGSRGQKRSEGSMSSVDTPSRVKWALWRRISLRTGARERVVGIRRMRDLGILLEVEGSD